MKNDAKIAGIQIASHKDETETLGRASELIGVAAKEGASIACLPPLFSRRWFLSRIDRKNFSLSETLDGETVTKMREAAENEKIIVIAPIFEKDGDEHYNTAVIICSDGSITGKYRKVHIPELPLWEEKSYFKPGNDFPVFDTPFGKIGVLICWDIFFPEAFRMLALKCAEIVFAPTSSAFKHSSGKWERAIQAAAHANGIYILRTNKVGSDGELNFYGGSFCAGPDGEFVVKPAGASEGVVVATADRNIIKNIRSEWVFMKDRRPKLYKEISKDGKN